MCCKVLGLKGHETSKSNHKSILSKVLMVFALQSMLVQINLIFEALVTDNKLKESGFQTIQGVQI